MPIPLFRFILKYLRFIFTAHSRKGHGIHSPFVYKLVSEVFLSPADQFYSKSLQWRRMMNSDKTIIDNHSCGAGSIILKRKKTRAGRLAKISGIPHKYGWMLYNMCRAFKPATVIELGTGLGVSTYYLAKANPDLKVLTLDDSSEKIRYSKSKLENEGISNVEFLTGNFDDLLPCLTQQLLHPMLVFIDGNHRYEPTVRYFNFFLKHAKENTIIIFDDIHWSGDMEQAWKLISSHASVSLSIDLFRCGIVFFKENVSGGSFLINY